jgi:Fe-S oxidoreductase
MLSTYERIAFILLLVLSIYFSWRSFSLMLRLINRGQDSLHSDNPGSRIKKALSAFLLQNTVLTSRPWISLIHSFVAWAFILYMLVNVGDILYGYISGFHFLGTGLVGNLYRLFVDIFSVLALIGVLILLIRRFFYKSHELQIRDNVLLMDTAIKGISRDSLLVGMFIFLHVGFRFLGESFVLSTTGGDPWQPLASSLAILWNGIDTELINSLIHVCWWFALGLILIFIPYFPKSKHAHLFMGPINYLTRPQRSAPGTLEKIDFEAEDAEQFGVAGITDLDKTQILDAYACIMCNRCQEACPAYYTGKQLSPSALEINKRYYLNQNGKKIDTGEDINQSFLDFGLTESALWACTSCAACVEICPVGNEPMYDILSIRRDRVLMEAKFPAQLQNAFNGMERNGNPWNMNKDRLEWTKEDPSLIVKTVDENPDFHILYWVGCAGTFDQKGQKIAQVFTKILNRAGINFSVMGNKENCTGDSARRAGNEYLFAMMAESNVENLNAAKVNKIVTTCPHCLHTLRNEYPQFGGNYEVIHHSQLIQDLISEGKIKLNSGAGKDQKIAFHDPCYLGRHNNIFDEPRAGLEASGIELVEMERNRNRSFCCGAGGGNMWKEEEEGEEAVRRERYQEAQKTDAGVLCTACPFCMTMLTDAGNELNAEMPVRDLAEIVVDKML